jgi:4-hydroxy-4-methyl-2-oxoglutarate aldolase
MRHFTSEWARKFSAPLDVAGIGVYTATNPAMNNRRSLKPPHLEDAAIKQTGKIGFRILTDMPRPDIELVKKFSGVAAANLADVMGRFRFMDPGIQNRTGLPLCGVAVTVITRPGDNLMVHKAMEVAGRGDIIVISTCGSTSTAVFGELMGNSAVAAGLGGLVVDGAVRDVAALRELRFPTFSRSVSAGACDKDGPGEINVPVSCGNAVVMPGDIVVGDADGVVIVPAAEAEEVLKLVAALQDREVKRIQEIRAGQVFKGEINDTLRAKGVIP